MMNILVLTVKPGLHGPLPKHYPEFINALEGADCQVTRLVWGRHSDSENLAEKFLGRLIDLIKVVLTTTKEHPDIIFLGTGHNFKALFRDIPLLITIHFTKTKKVSKMHGSKSCRLVEPGLSFFKILTRWFIKLNDAILVLSNEELEEWKIFSSEGSFFQVDNPFLLKSEFQDSYKNEGKVLHSKINLLFVGRLIKAKGVYDLLDAMPIILNQRNCHLLIAGEGVEAEGLKNKIADEGLDKSVSMMGYLKKEELNKIYNSASIFILPTYYAEGFPTVLAEAMSHGLPIITTKLRGAADHLKDGVNTVFVPPKNPAAIANAVLKIINEPRLRYRIKQENIKKLMDFSPEKIANQHIEVFKEVINPDIKSLYQ